MSAARTFPFTVVYIGNVETGATFGVPNILLTVADLQAAVDNRSISGTANILCETCGESVHDCPILREKLTGVPSEWGWEAKAEMASR